MKAKISFVIPGALLCVLTFVLMPLSVFGQSTPTFVSTVPDACSRFPAGSVVHNPPALFSRNGSLTVNFWR
jgi:hypothetical protein